MYVISLYLCNYPILRDRFILDSFCGTVKVQLEMKKDTKILVGKIILATIATAGVLTVAVAAPNAVQCIKMFYPDQKRKYKVNHQVNRTIKRLKQQGLIKFEKRNDQSFVRLTEKGKERLLKYQMQELEIKKPKKWDKKWRVVIFDIKEKRKHIREGLRKELIRLNFVKLQNSVWVHPYKCDEIIAMFKAHFKIGKDVLYMTVDTIENDKWLKEEFRLR